MIHPHNGSDNAYERFVNREKYPRVSTCKPSVFSSIGKDAASSALSALSSAAIMTRRSIGSLHKIADDGGGDIIIR